MLLQTKQAKKQNLKRNLVYKATGKPCELSGIKGSGEGTMISVGPMKAQNVAALPIRNIFVEGATGGTPREVKLESSGEQVFKFPTANKTISCSSMIWKGSTGFATLSQRFFNTLTATGCTSNILLTGGNPSPATVTAEKCVFGIGVSRNRVFAEQPGTATLNNPGEECKFEAKVTSGAENCTIRMLVDDWGGSLKLKNEGTNPKTVGVKFPAGTIWVRYTPAGMCPGVAGAGALAHFEGNSIFRAFAGGIEKNVEIR
jgi:hypothetical protein